jgi:hypothetical protein
VGAIRLKIMAHAIRHEQQGEIALMHGMNGVPAVSLAIRNMFADRVNRASATRFGPDIGAVRKTVRLPQWEAARSHEIRNGVRPRSRPLR